MPCGVRLEYPPPQCPPTCHYASGLFWPEVCDDDGLLLLIRPRGLLALLSVEAGWESVYGWVSRCLLLGGWKAWIRRTASNAWGSGASSWELCHCVCGPRRRFLRRPHRRLRCHRGRVAMEKSGPPMPWMVWSGLESQCFRGCWWEIGKVGPVERRRKEGLSRGRFRGCCCWWWWTGYVECVTIHTRRLVVDCQMSGCWCCHQLDSRWKPMLYGRMTGTVGEGEGGNTHLAQLMRWRTGSCEGQLVKVFKCLSRCLPFTRRLDEHWSRAQSGLQLAVWGFPPGQYGGTYLGTSVGGTGGFRRPSPQAAYRRTDYSRMAHDTNKMGTARVGRVLLLQFVAISIAHWLCYDAWGSITVKIGDGKSIILRNRSASNLSASTKLYFHKSGSK